MTGTSVAVQSQGSLALRGDQVDWTDQQRAALAQIGVDEAPPGDQLVFLHVAQRMGLDPFAREIYMIGRWDSELNRKRWTIQVGIDGFRSKSEEHPEFGGVGDEEWCGPDGVWHDVWVFDEPPTAARFTVYRRGDDKPIRGTAHYREYVQTKRDGKPTIMWATRPAGQLIKCFDDETDVLTEYGYRRFADVNGARIMQVTGGGLEAVAATPFVQEYAGLMVTLDSDDLNFSVTPNHDMVTTFGTVEAGAMYATALSRPTWRIPRLPPPATGPGIDVSDDAIRLAGAIVADGFRASNGWRIEVSRPAKITALDSLGMAYDRYVHGTKGDESTSRKSGRVIRSNFDKQGYRYHRDTVVKLVDDDKHLRISTIRMMNTKQARLLVDTLIEFDGSINRLSKVRRFYSSDPRTIGAFELAATIAGYTVNSPTPRSSDLSERINWWLTISERDACGFIKATDGRKSVTMVPNASGRVWCVTVPSGRIMVRRRGFAMVCGNCAEALARRRAFPRVLGGIHSTEEMEHLDNPQPAPTVVIAERVEASATEPDWDALITKHETARDVGKLWDLRKLAQGMRPNDGPLLNRIAEAWQRTKNTVAAADADTQAPAKSQMNRLFALLGEGGITSDEHRHRLASHHLDRDITTFTALTANDVSRLIADLEKLKAEGRLTKPSPDASPADQTKGAKE